MASKAKSKRRAVVPPKKTVSDEPSSLDLIEEAVQLLRQAPLAAWTAYAIGTLPFLLAFLFFCTAASRSADTHQWLAAGALALALLYLAMKLAQARFAAGLRAVLTRQPAAPFPGLRPFLGQLLFQLRWHSTAWIALPAASLLTLPFPAVFAYYQNLCILGGDASSSETSELRRRAWKEAQRWPLLTMRACFFFSLGALLMLINVLGSIALATMILKGVFGVETVFSRSLYLLFHPLMLVLAAIIAFLALDPVMKAFFLLKCHYGESRTTGLDLRVRLQSRNAGRRPALVLAAALIFAGAPMSSLEATPHPEAPDGLAGTAVEIDRSIEETLKDPRFAWKLPRQEKPEPEEIGFLFDLLKWIVDFLERWAPVAQQDEVLPAEPSGWGASLDWLFYLLIALAALGLILFLLHVLRRRRAGPPPLAATAAFAENVDVNDENLTADRLSRNEWIRLGMELRGQKDYRAALRAFFLGQLALLQDLGQLRLARHKSNREYLGELRLREHSHPGLMENFSGNMAVFEACWYGDHAADEDTVESFVQRLDQLERIAG